MLPNILCKKTSLKCLLQRHITCKSNAKEVPSSQYHIFLDNGNNERNLVRHADIRCYRNTPFTIRPYHFTLTYLKKKQ